MGSILGNIGDGQTGADADISCVGNLLAADQLDDAALSASVGTLQDNAVSLLNVKGYAPAYQSIPTA